MLHECTFQCGVVRHGLASSASSSNDRCGTLAGAGPSEPTKPPILGFLGRIPDLKKGICCTQRLGTLAVANPV
jgi:hypothetical protein